MAPMHVVLASHQQLPAKGYGGPQRVVVALVRGLAALGHRVTLLALPGSRVAEATLVEVPARKFGAAADLAAYVPRDADILHTHLPLKPGPARPGAQAALLARAGCRWNPAQWDEPFGLVTVEALLSGTPVLGTRRGALPELITPEVGALCDTLEEMMAAAQVIHTRSPEACRALAERRFTHLLMADEHVRMDHSLRDNA